MNYAYMDDVLGIGATSPEIHVTGYCDIVIQGLTSGSVKLQYLLSKTTELPAPVWTDFPDGSFTTDTFSTMFMSAVGVYFRFVGVTNNAGVYVKIARGRDE